MGSEMCIRDRAKIAFSIVGIIAPIVFVRFAANARAPKFGEYPIFCTTSNTRSLVPSTTRSGVLRHRDTVAVETFASSATSSNVGTDFFLTAFSKNVLRGHSILTIYDAGE